MEMNRQLARKVTGVEIKEAVFSIHQTKLLPMMGRLKRFFNLRNEREKKGKNLHQSSTKPPP